MEKFELEDSLKEDIRSRTLGEGFMKLVQTVRRGGTTFKIALRPVEIGGVRKYQAEMTDDGQVQVKNFDANAVVGGLEEIIAQKGARDLHLMTAKGDVHVRVTKKGHVMVSRSVEMDRVVEVRGHDRVKKTPLTSFESGALLRTIGIADGEGKVRASMRGKYDQVNEFLKVVGETVPKYEGKATALQENGKAPDGAGKAAYAARNPLSRTAGALPLSCDNVALPAEGFSRAEGALPFTVVDCGCGKAYLTISLWYYLSEVLKYPSVRVIGIDRRNDVITAAQKMAKQLDLADKVVFVEADLETFNFSNLSNVSDFSNLQRADLVCSLHACDTATDEALARGVEWKARYILSAPCCQHELQKHLGDSSNWAQGASGEFAGLLRQSILRERMCDILTDAYRAMIMRILGFKTQVIEFVSSEATARNIMLKCEYGVKPGQPGPVGEYLALRDFWKVTPWLETRLGKLLSRYLARFE